MPAGPRDVLAARWLREPDESAQPWIESAKCVADIAEQVSCGFAQFSFLAALERWFMGFCGISVCLQKYRFRLPSLRLGAERAQRQYRGCLVEQQDDCHTRSSDATFGGNIQFVCLIDDDSTRFDEP